MVECVDFCICSHPNSRSHFQTALVDDPGMGEVFWLGFYNHSGGSTVVVRYLPIFKGIGEYL